MTFIAVLQQLPRKFVPFKEPRGLIADGEPASGSASADSSSSMIVVSFLKTALPTGSALIVLSINVGSARDRAVTADSYA